MIRCERILARVLVRSDCEYQAMHCRLHNTRQRSLGGVVPYLPLFARTGLSRAAIDAEVAAANILELPSARGAAVRWLLDKAIVQVVAACDASADAGSLRIAGFLRRRRAGDSVV